MFGLDRALRFTHRTQNYYKIYRYLVLSLGGFWVCYLEIPVRFMQKARRSASPTFRGFDWKIFEDIDGFGGDLDNNSRYRYSDNIFLVLGLNMSTILSLFCCDVSRAPDHASVP